MSECDTRGAAFQFRQQFVREIATVRQQFVRETTTVNIVTQFAPRVAGFVQTNHGIS